MTFERTFLNPHRFGRREFAGYGTVQVSYGDAENEAVDVPEPSALLASVFLGLWLWMLKSRLKRVDA